MTPVIYSFNNHLSRFDSEDNEKDIKTYFYDTWLAYLANNNFQEPPPRCNHPPENKDKSRNYKEIKID